MLLKLCLTLLVSSFFFAIPLTLTVAEAATHTAGVTTTTGSWMDSGNRNAISSTQVTTDANAGTLSSIRVYIGSVNAAPSNHMRVAIYADNGSNTPGALLGSSAAKVLTANSWNTFPMSTINIAANTKYWLGFNVDGRNTKYALRSNALARTAWKIPTTYGTWPNPFGTPSEPITADEYSIYMTYESTITPTPTATPTPTPTNTPSPTPTSTPTPTDTPTPTPTVTPTPTPTGPDFPRIGGMLIGDPHNYDETAYQQQIAKLDMAVLGMYRGWTRAGKTMAQVVSEIKTLNPTILLANYTIMEVATYSESDTSQAPWRAKLSSEQGPNGIGDWWAYDSNGNHTNWSGGEYPVWDTNLTLLVTPDANGDRWPQWKAKYDYQTLLQGTGFDYWYSDDNFWKPRIDNDWNRDGTNDSQNNITVRNWWRDGQRAYYDTAKTVAPSLTMMVNADSDLDGSVFPANADQFTQYKNVLGGAFMEHAIGKDWSAESWGGWNTMMNWYRQLKSNLAAPQTVMFDAYMANVSDYQSLRYAFASALMDDGYFSASTDYNQIPWYDEFDLAGTSTTKWLGKALQGPQTTAWQNGVYRRNFEHGTVLVNPKGNGSKTVTLESGYHRIQGTQAPTVNNGQPVSTLTLNDRDGILLIKN